MPGSLEDLRFPIGRFVSPTSLDGDMRARAIASIEALPGRVREATSGLDDSQLDTPYRPDGWTVRQVVHHLPDSHVNGYVRFKLALTEDAPTIRPYLEDRWGSLIDAVTAPIGPSIQLLEGLHTRWASMLRMLSAEDFGRRIDHPEAGTPDLNEMVALYAWHGRHHVAHIIELRKRNGW